MALPKALPKVSKTSVKGPQTIKTAPLVSNYTPEELIQFRVRHNLTQKTLADVLGVTYFAVRLWELGERDISLTVVRLLKTFDKYPQLMKEFVL